MSLLDTASLIVTPNAYAESKLYSVIPSDGSGDMSVVRATTATRVNSAGLVELVPYNLLLQSNTFSTTWTNSNSTETSGQTGYDGTNNAWLLSKSAASGYITQSISLSGSQTFSVYAKAGTDNWMVLLITGFSAYYDLQNGVVGTAAAGATATITSVGNGWYRCMLTASATTASVRIYPAEGNNDTSGTTGNVYIQDAQLVEGSTAKDYQKTETRLNIPRLDYSNGTCPSLLVEPQRTNLLTYSSSFDNAAWVKYDTFVTSNIATSPSGVQDADKIIPNTNNTNHNVDRAALTVSLNGTASVFLKASGYNKAAIRSYFTGAYASFDLVNGTILTAVGVTAKIENYGNGWYRCSVNDTGSALYGYVLAVLDASSDPTATYIGDGTSGVLAWGAQLEVGSYPTSYIPTQGASVTRNADVISKTGISSLIGQTEGTLFIDFVYNEKYGSSPNGAMPISLDDGSGSQEAYIYLEPSNNRALAQFVVGGALTCSITGLVMSVGTRYRMAFAYKQNDFTFYVNGTLQGTDTSGNIAALSNVRLCNYSSLNYIHDNLYSAALWKTRLDNATLEQLTTI